MRQLITNYKCVLRGCSDTP